MSHTPGPWTARTSYYTGTREETLQEFHATHRKRDIVPGSVRVHRSDPEAVQCWYVTYRLTRAAIRRMRL